MDEQILKDFVATAEKYNYDWNAVFDLFPELKNYDQQLLKDYTATAKKYNYDWGKANSYFPEFGFGAEQQPVAQQPVQQPLVPMSPLKKKEASTSPSESGVLERYGFNAKRALGQEEQKPIMTQPLPERLQPAQKKDSKTWERETALPEVITDYTKPIEEVSLLRPKEKPAEEPLGLIGRYVPERDEKKTPKFIEETLSALTPDKFNLTGTEPSKKALEYYLKDMGFKIEDSDKSSSYAGKYVNVISPSGEKHLFYLGNEIIRKETFGYAGLPSEDDIEQLKDFVRASAFSDSSIAKKEYLYEKENKKFKTKESIDNEVKDISAQEQKFQDDYKSMLALQKDIEDIEKDLKRWEDFGEQNTPKYIQTKAYLNDKIKEYNDYIGTLKNKEATLSTQAQQLEKSMGKYFEFQSTQGSFEGTLYRSIAESSANIFSNYVRAATSRTIDALPMSALMDEDLYKEERLRKLKEKGYEDGTAPQSAIEEVDAEIRDRFKKAAITGKVGEEKLQNVLTVQGVRESLKDFVTSVPVMGTSEYKERREKEGGFVERGVIGLAGSLPAMVGNRYLRLANMFMMTTDAVMQEMDNDPSFANVSENEKELIAAPIGVIGAALEEIGLRNLIKGTSITSSIVKSVLGRVPSNATASTIRKATFDAVKEMGLRGTVALAGATLAEAETGAAQQISEYAVKDIYNAMKGEKRFDNPAFLSGQYFYDIYDAARTEAVGGFVMGVPYSAAAAFKKDGFRGLDDQTFKIFEQLAKDNDSKKFFVTDLKNKINRGEITPQQGKQMLDAYNEASGMIGVVPDEITDTESRKIAMDLLSERKKLEAKKQGKDDALAKPIQDKINQINEQLSKLTEDAIQKQAAGEVSLQPETGAGQEVEIGGPEAKPKITPEESKRKEDLIAALEATDKDVIAIGDELLDRKEAQAELEAITQKEQAPVIEQGGMEQAPAKGAVEKKDIQVYRGTSTGNRSEKDGVSYYTPDRGYASFYETGKEKPENKALEELESLKTPTKPSKIELSTNEEIDAYVDDYISMAEDAKKFKPETKIPSREEAISELKKQNQIFTTQEEVDNANNKQDEKYNSDLEKYNQRKSELEDEAKNYLSPKKLSGNFFSLGIDFSKMNSQQIFEKLKSLGISSEFKGGNFLDNYHSDLVEFARKNNIDFYDGITGGVQGSMNVAPQEIIEISKIEQAPITEVTPVEQQFTEQDRARKAELEEAMRKADKRRKNITVGETTMPKAEAKAELDALVQKEQATVEEIVPVKNPAFEKNPKLADDVYNTFEDSEVEYYDKIPIEKGKYYRVTGMSEINSILDNKKLQTPEKSYYDRATLTKISKNSNYSIEQLEEINSSDPQKIRELFVEYVQKPAKEKGEVVLNPRTKSSHGDIGFQKEGFFGDYNPDEIGSGFFGAPVIVGSESKSKFLQGHHGGYSGRINEEIKENEPVVLRDGFDSENFEYWLYKDGKGWYKQSFNNPLKQQAQNSYSEYLSTTKTPTIEGFKEFIKSKKPTETRTPEQEADLLEELLTGKKKEPVMAETVTPTVTPTAEVKEESPALANVEETAKALEKLDKKKYKQIESGSEDVNRRGVKFSDIFIGDTLLEDLIATLSEEVKRQVKEIFSRGIDYFKFNEAEQKSWENKFVNPEDFNEVFDMLATSGLARESAYQFYNDTNYEYVKGEINYILKNKNEYSKEFIEVVEKINQKLKNPQNSMQRLYAIDIAESLGFSKSPRQISEAYHKAKADGSNPELVQAVEEALGKPKVKAEPTSKEAKSLADAVRRNLKIKGPGGLQSNILGIPVAIWNAGVETMAKAIEASVAINEAVQKAIEHIREKHGKKFNEAAAEKKLLIGHYKGAIEVAREAKVTNEGLKTYLKRQGLTDAQIEPLLKIKERAEKKPISKEKIIGKPKPKKVTVNEMTALKDQLRLEAKAAREAKGDLNAKRKMLAAAIKEMQKKGKITVRQAAVLINKVNSVNLDNPVMVERMLNYAEKVFNNAEFVEKMSRARKLLKTAKENVRTKIGVSKGLTTLMDKLFNINPNIIPDDVLESYLELVETMGKRQAVLTLKEAAELTKDVEKVLNAVIDELSTLDDLIEIFDNYNKKVVDENGKIDFSATLDKMLEDGIITANDVKLYKKYKDKVLPKEAKEKKSKEQLAEEKNNLIDAIKQTQVDESNLGMREERDAARKLFDAMTPENLAGLTNAELANLLKVLDNINNGFFPHYAMKMTQKLNSVSRKATLGEAIANAGRLPITKLIANIKSLFPGAKTANMIMVIESPKYVLDQVFGFFKTSPIYDSVFKPLTQAFSSYKTDARKVKEKLDKAFNKVARSYMNNPAKIKMSQFKMMTYALQLEYNSNKDKGEGFYSAAEYIKETIKHAGSNQSTMSKKDKKLLGKVLEVYGVKDADGNFIDIDIDKIYNSFNNAEKQALKTIQEVNLSLRDKAMFTAAVIHGGKIEPIDNYVSHNVLPTGVANKKISSVYDEMNTRMMPSTKAATLKERTEGVKPLNFNIFGATQRSANQVLMDFNLTEAVRTSRMVLNELGKDIMENGTDKQQSIFNAINDSFKTTLENTLMNTFNDSSFTDKVISMITKQAYRTLLAGVTRWTAELMSNLAYIAKVGPLEYISGVTKYRKYAVSEKGPAILRNIDSAVQDRVYEDSVLSGRMIDSSIMDEAIGLEGTTSNYMVVNAMQTIYNNTLKKGQNFVAATADTLISTPDKMALRPFYFGLFAKEFKKITGQDVNLDKISENDEAYLKKFKEAIEKSKDAADYHIMLAGGTKNPFASRQKAMTLKNATASAQIYQSFNNFMNNFIINEYIAARTGTYAMMGNGRISQRQGAAVLAGVVARTTLYTFLIKELGRGLAWLFLGDDDEEDEEKSIIEKAGQAFAGSMTSLILGRDFGNMTRSMINYGVEKVNENYVQDMMDGKYTKEDVIAYNSLIPGSLNTRPQFSDLMINMSGSGQPFLRSLKNLYENSFAAEAKGEDTIKKRENYWKYTLPLEAAGHLGFVPLYKDVRTITNKALQGEVNAIKEAKEEEKASKAEAYGNYETLEEFEKKDPIKYDEYSAPGGKLYKYREKERLEFEEKNKDKPFFGHSEKKFKELYPEDYAKYYGPGTNYYKSQRTPEMLQKKAQEKRDEAKRERERKMKEAIRKREENIRKALSK